LPRSKAPVTQVVWTFSALADVEEAFSVEAVTKEFFTKYAELFGEIHEALEKLVDKVRREPEPEEHDAIDGRGQDRERGRRIATRV